MLRGLLIPVVLAGACAWPSALVQGSSMSDDQFIEALGSNATNEAVDRKQLARVFFSLAATLDGGKSSLRLLQSEVVVPEATRRAVRGLLNSRYEEYALAVEQFKGSVSQLLDEPHSMLLLYRTIIDGQRTCWYLDLHNRLVETYGTRGTELMSVLSSREACSRLRTAIFQPRVEGLVQDALVEQIYQREEIRELREELGDLEELLQDLHEIDTTD